MASTAVAGSQRQSQAVVGSRILARSGGILERSGLVLGRSGASWGHSGALLESSRASWARSGAFGRRAGAFGRVSSAFGRVRACSGRSVAPCASRDAVKATLGSFSCWIQWKPSQCPETRARTAKYRSSQARYWNYGSSRAKPTHPIEPKTRAPKRAPETTREHQNAFTSVPKVKIIV
jgi:hypothetical protein